MLVIDFAKELMEPFIGFQEVGVENEIFDFFMRVQSRK